MLKILYLLSVIKEKIWKTYIYCIYDDKLLTIFLFFSPSRWESIVKFIFYTSLFLKLLVTIFVVHLHLYIYRICIQWNISKPNPLGTSFCVWNIQVFGLHRLKFTKISNIGSLFKVRFIQDVVLFRLQFRQVSLYKNFFILLF